MADADNKKSNVKILDCSPTRSCSESVKSANASKTNKLPLRKVSAKSETENRNGPLRKINPKVESKIVSSMASKSSSSINRIAKSKIPAMKGSTLDATKTVAEPKPSAKQNKARASVQQKSLSVKKQLEMKQKQITSSNLKSNNCVSESSDVKSLGPSSVKCNFAAIAGKQSSKCESSRSRISFATPRSASYISTQSTACSAKKEMISAAGDCVETQDVENEAKQSQNDLLPAVQPEDVEVNDDLKCNMNADLSSPQIELKDTDEIKSCDAELISKSDNLLSIVNDVCPNCKGISVDKFKRELEESNNALKQMEAKYKDLVQTLEADRLQLEKDLREKAEADIAKKEKDIKELRKKSQIHDKEVNNFKSVTQNLEKEKDCIQTEKDNLQEELKTCRDCLSTTNKKLQDSQQQLKTEKRNVENKTDLINKMECETQKLIKDLAEMTAKLEVLETESNKRAHMECDELVKRIAELSYQINCLETGNGVLIKQNEKLEQEVLEFATVKEKLLESENKLQELQAELNRKETGLAKMTDCSKEVQMEFAKLRRNEAEKQREIEMLKTELSKTQFNICHLEDQIQRSQELLDVRSGLINSMQKNEKTQRIHIEDLFAQVAEKNNTINELNSELQMKSEEFRNFLSSLSAKQIEVANQEHIVKLLEESNERSQMLRVKQEEKIGRLEKELAHLKQTIAFYQAKALAANSDSHLVCRPPTNVNYNENFYYYVSERKRKRHIDINVKKYEV